MSRSEEAALLGYYARRAREYDALYEKPERQEDLLALKERIAAEFSGHDVLELAAGTGYWTETLARSARSVLATDAGEDVLDVARSKTWPADGRVRFRTADAWNPDAISGRFTAAFCGFFWSHIPRPRIAEFLAGLTHRLGTGGLAVFIDNVFVTGSSTPLSRRDEDGNTYQERRLRDGTAHEVLKNFPDRPELEAALKPHGDPIDVTMLRYFWHLSFRIRQGLFRGSGPRTVPRTRETRVPAGAPRRNGPGRHP